MRLFRAQLNANVPSQGSAAYHSPGVRHSWSKKVPPKLTIIAQIASHFSTFFPLSEEKCNFAAGFDLEKQLQLIAASESHLSFIFGLTQRRNQNLQKRKQPRLGIWQTNSSFKF